MEQILRKFLLLISLISLCFAATEPASPPRNDIHSVESALAITAPDQLMAELTARLNDMADLLDKAVDAPSAHRICPDAERSFLEIELINLRVSMLQPFPAEDLAKLKPLREAYDRARAASERHHQRIRANPALLKELHSLFAPMGQAYTQDQLFHLTLLEYRNFLAAMQAKSIRMDINFYRIEHRGQFPDIRKLGWDALTKPTAIDGTLDPDSKLGPYTKNIPKNGVTGRSQISAIHGTPQANFKSTLPEAGFVYDELSGDTYALDRDGRIINPDQPAHADVR